MQTFGLIGYPLGHSFSQNFFSSKFQNEGIDAQYLNFEIPTIEDLTAILKTHSSLQGFNVTIPYKEKIIPFLSGISDEAKAIGAVNVVRVVKNNHGEKSLIGYNSDVFGFVESIRPLLKPHHQKALVLGTGGASKAVHYGLQKMGIKTLSVSRNKKEKSITYEEVNALLLNEYQIIVNCTPLGMHPKTKEKPQIPYHLINESHLLYDLVYNPEITSFLKEGIDRGAITKNGLDMLHLQAIKAWEIWNEL